MSSPELNIETAEGGPLSSRELNIELRRVSNELTRVEY